jgi:diguanylate cyclase (GGDEF)-like protein
MFAAGAWKLLRHSAWVTISMTVNGTGSFDLKAFLSSGPIRWLIGCGLVLIAAIAIGTTIMVDNFRERALNGHRHELENTVQLLTRHFDQQLEDFTIILREIASRVRSDGITAELFRGQLATLEWHEELRTEVSAYSDAASISVFDASGTLINSSEVWPVPAVKVADRNYFNILKSGTATTPIQIELVRGRIVGGWATIVAQRLTGPNGEFLGIVTRTIQPATFEKYFASVALREGAAISIYRRDGTLLARYPHIEAMIGSTNRNSSISPYISSPTGRGTVRQTSPIDGQERLASVNGLRSFPIAIVASVTVEAALADWREQTRFLILLATVSAVVIAAMLSLFMRKLLQQHRAEKQRLDTAINNMSQGLLLYDSSERLIVCNQRYISMYGLSPDIVKPGLSFRDLVAYRKKTGSFKGDIDAFVSGVLRNVAIGKITHNTVETADGRLIQIVNHPLKNGWLTTHEDITERAQAEEKIRHLAHYDALTDLPNRVLFHERLRQELARVTAERQLAVLYIDIDEFKSVNDSLGHMVGDELLKSVAARLGSCLEKNSGFVARLGGDEFAIVKTGVTDSDDVADIVTAAQEAIRAPFDCLGHQVTSDASIGVALAPLHGTDLDQILKNADLAMYAAKSAGRRTWRFFEPAMDAQVRARRTLETDLRKAIADQALEVYYQPCLSLQSDRIIGCEALVRWRHPERGMISPVEFIPIAEETGLINELGEWVLAKACAEAANWPEGVKLAVNVSPVQFRSGTLALKIVSALNAAGLPANRLELEITEAVLIRDDDAALEILHQLRAIGVRIALDDFGTGYSSLSYLRRFPFDKIKIDRCFVNDLDEAGGSSIVQAVVNIATARQMTTTAEGVETQQQQELLRALGCTEMQGYLFSPPKPAEQVREILFTHRARPAAVA